jgi:hypothetical protein
MMASSSLGKSIDMMTDGLAAEATKEGSVKTLYKVMEEGG